MDEPAPQPNPQLLDYVAQARILRMKDLEIQQELLNAGWPASEITTALAFSATVPLIIPSSSYQKRSRLPFFIALLAIAAASYYWLFEGGKWWWYFNVSHEAIPPSGFTPNPHSVGIPLPPGEMRYVNERFGFNITYHNPWRLAVDFSRELSSARHAANYFDDNGESTLDCAINKSCSHYLESALREFFSNWNVADSDIVVLVDLSEEEEHQFLRDVVARRKTLQDFPRGHWIEVFPTGIAANFGKETPSDSSSGIRVRFMPLRGGVQARQTDARTIGAHLSLLVPHDFGEHLDSGQLARSLNFLTSVEPGSDAEKAFYKLVDSLRF